MLTISVKNLGPIAEGSVDLKPLTIFVGPSNTGKSYMATAVWAVVQAFSRDYFPFPREFRIGGSYSRIDALVRLGRSGFGDEYDDYAEVVSAFQEWFDSLDEPSGEFTGFRLVDLPETVQLAVDRRARQNLVEIREMVLGQLRQAYGNDSEFTRSNRTEDFDLTVQRDKPLLYMGVQLVDNEEMLKFSVSDAEVPVPGRRNAGRDLRFRGRNAPEEILGATIQSAIHTTSAGFPTNSYYLPAARSGIAQGHKVLAASLARQSRLVGLEPISIPSLPGMATEFLSQLISLDRRTPRQQPQVKLNEAIKFIENKITGGKIDLDDSQGLPYPEITYESSTGSFTLDHSSSMVSELAPLVLFLKYLVRPGDLLIIEEPESHLHSAAQRQMAQGIVRLVNAGVKVQITTHSETFVSQINHLLRISYASKRWLKEHHFEPEDCITHDQVGAYQFGWDKEQGGSVVKQLEVHKDIGIDESEFISVIDSLYEESLLVQRIRVKE